MRVCLGGTFHPFHVGHEALLREAIRDADALYVGITEGELAHRLDREVPHWKERARPLEAFLDAQGFAGERKLAPLLDAVGPAATGSFDAIVVSPETVPGAHRINAARASGGLLPLDLRIVPHVLGPDQLPISATAVAEGRIDRTGRRLRPVLVAVGSTNPVKVVGVEAAVASLLETPVEVKAVGVETGVPEQPREEETLRGARTRAAAALAATKGADYGIGVEAGLMTDPDGTWFDVQACITIDRDGHTTEGWGPAFAYPEWVTRQALAGAMVSDVLGPVAGDGNIGGTTGAIGYLSRGHMDRTELTRVAVLMAFVPRLRRHLYQMEPKEP